MGGWRAALHEAAEREASKQRARKQNARILAPEGANILDDVREGPVLERAGETLDAVGGLPHDLRGRALVAARQVVAGRPERTAERDKTGADIPLSRLGLLHGRALRVGSKFLRLARNLVTGVVQGFAGRLRFPSEGVARLAADIHLSLLLAAARVPVLHGRYSSRETKEGEYRQHDDDETDEVNDTVHAGHLLCRFNCGGGPDVPEKADFSSRRRHNWDAAEARAAPANDKGRHGRPPSLKAVRRGWKVRAGEQTPV
jgi:hypothetical protein